MDDYTPSPRLIVGIVAGGLFFILAVVLALGSFGTVDAGHRGVVKHWGAVTGEIKEEGFYTKIPFADQVIEVDVRQGKEQVETEGASKDLQTVHATIALNLSIDPTQCAKIYQTIGVEYKDIIVAPAMQESIKAVLAQYTAEELISKRELVRDGIAQLIATKLTSRGIRTDALNIVNFNFSGSFNAAIEAKVTAEQNALAAKNLLAQKEYEAQQLVATAKGKAEAMSIESAALEKNPQVLQLRAIEKWNGILPQFSGGGAVPFVNVGSLQGSGK